MIEIFREIEGYEGYQISNKGNVKSLKYGKERILKPIKDKNGYLVVNLSKQGKLKIHKVHRLVCEAFLPNPDNYPIVNHKDEDKTNNNVTNLEWCTMLYNNNYGTRNQKSAESHSKPVLCIETSVVYPSIKEIRRQFGFNNGYISSVCNGKYKQAYGYTWRFIS